jgi:hypothetical protein
MMPKFKIGQKVVNFDVVGTVMAINDAAIPVEYWVKDSGNNCLTYREGSLEAYVRPFDPKLGETYLNLDHELDATVIARFETTDGTIYIAYQWYYGGQFKAAILSLADFKVSYPEFKED